MTDVVLDVPLLAQAKTNSCWFACLRMINAYFGAPTTNPFPKLFEKNRTLPEAKLPEFAQKVGMTFLEPDHAYDTAGLQAVLRTRGPIYAPAAWFGKLHVVVLRSCRDDGSIELNDPLEDVAQISYVDDMAEFTKGYLQCLMVKDRQTVRSAARRGAAHAARRLARRPTAGRTAQDL